MSSAGDAYSAESFEFHTFLAPGLGPAYDDFHRAIPAELDAAMRAAGVVGWQIYRNRTTLTHRVVAQDRQRMSRILDRDPVNARWQQQVAPYLAPPTGAPGTVPPDTGPPEDVPPDPGNLVWDFSWPTR
jgi:L-rhamnose mutarotase